VLGPESNFAEPFRIQKSQLPSIAALPIAAPELRRLGEAAVGVDDPDLALPLFVEDLAHITIRTILD